METVQVRKTVTNGNSEEVRIMTLPKDVWERMIKKAPAKNVKWELVAKAIINAKETVLIPNPNSVSTKTALSKKDEATDLSDKKDINNSNNNSVDNTDADAKNDTNAATDETNEGAAGAEETNTDNAADGKINYSNYTDDELKDLAKNAEIKGYQLMKRETLINKLSAQ